MLRRETSTIEPEEAPQVMHHGQDGVGRELRSISGFMLPAGFSTLTSR